MGLFKFVGNVIGGVAEVGFEVAKFGVKATGAVAGAVIKTAMNDAKVANNVRNNSGNLSN